MPTYEFQCKKCGHKFNLRESIEQHTQHQEKCPECAAADVRSLLSAVTVKTPKKS